MRNLLNTRRTAVLLLTLVLGMPTAAPAQAGIGDALAPGEGNWTLGGEPCNLIEVPTATPIGVGACPGVRPGAVIESDNGLCTMNFLFLGSDGRRYIGTAGHCILGDSPTGGDAGEQSWAPGAGPEARDGEGNRIGEFAYAILQDPKDFALVRLDAGVQADPQMCHFGGPTGINSDTPGLSAPVQLEHFGNGIGTGTLTPGRTALALGMPDPDHVYAEGAVAPGDSGSGIISADGRAVGVIVTVGVHAASIGTSGIDAGSVGITRIAPQEARAEQVLGLTLTIQTAPKL
ncbi:MAG: hypothetical protein ACRDKZ_14070 [Actinomycetota bacterium]